MPLRKLLGELLKADKLPDALDARIRAFDPKGFDLAKAAAVFAGDPSDRKRKLELVAAVGDADEVLDTREDDYLVLVAKADRRAEESYADLVPRWRSCATRSRPCASPAAPRSLDRAPRGRPSAPALERLVHELPAAPGRALIFVARWSRRAVEHHRRSRSLVSAASTAPSRPASQHDRRPSQPGSAKRPRQR